MTGRVLAVMAIGVAATGCLSIRTNMAKEPSTIEALADLERAGTTATVSLRDRVRIAANDWVAGRVREVGPDGLVVQPYLPWEPEVALPTYEGMPVLQGEAVVGRERLRPGADVRAFLDDENGQLGLVAVELLTPEEALRLSSGLSGTAPAPTSTTPKTTEPTTTPKADPTRWEI